MLDDRAASIDPTPLWSTTSSFLWPVEKSERSEYRPTYTETGFSTLYAFQQTSLVGLVFHIPRIKT